MKWHSSKLKTGNQNLNSYRRHMRSKATTKEINPVYKESSENEDYPGHTAADFTHGPSQPFYCHSKPEPCLFAGTLTLAPPFNALVITIAGRMSRRDNEPHHNNCASKNVHRYFHLGMIVEL